MNKLLSFLLIVVFFVISLQFIISNARSLKTVDQDFEVFYLSGKQVINGKNPYMLIGKDIIRNPPPALLLFTLLPLLPIKTSQIVWFILSFISFIAGSYYLFKILDKVNGNKSSYEKNWKIWLIYLSLAFIFFPFRYNLGSGQVNNFLFLLLVLTFYLLQSKKELWSALFLSLAILLKITPIFLLFTLFLEKKIKVIVWTFIDTILISVTTFLLLGYNIFKNYFGILKSFFNFGIQTYYNQSLSGFMARTFNNFALTQWVNYILVLTGVFFLVLYYRKPVKNYFISELIIWNISIIYLLLLAPFAWQYHFVIIIFPLVTTFYIIYRKKIFYRLFFFLILSYLLIGWNIKNPNTIYHQSILGSILLSHVFFGSLILLFVNYSLLRNYHHKK